MKKVIAVIIFLGISAIGMAQVRSNPVLKGADSTSLPAAKVETGNTPPHVASSPYVLGSNAWFEGGNLNTVNNTIGTCNPIDFILKANNTSALWVKPNGNVGIGTINPSAKFEITGDLRIGAPTLGGTAFELVTTGYPGDSRFKVFGDGKTYIGTFVSPPFDVNGSTLTVGQSVKSNKAFNIVDNTNLSAPADFFTVYGDGRTEIKTANASNKALSIVDNAIPNTPNDLFTVYGDGKTYFVGNVGIGTTLPSAKLNIVQATSATGFQIDYKVTTPYSYAQLTSVQSNDTKALAIINTTNNTSSENFIIYGDGRTEIKTVIASNKALNIIDNTNPNTLKDLFTIYGDGRTEIKTVTPSNKVLNIIDNTIPAIPKDLFTVYGDGYTEIKVYSPLAMFQPPGGSPRAFTIKDMANNKDIFVVNSNGKIYAREVEISLTTTFPDYVFEKDYKLKSITEVSDFITKNGHLPGFENEEYYEKNNINVNDMLMKQQEKIEELMLYIIELEKRLSSVEKR